MTTMSRSSAVEEELTVSERFDLGLYERPPHNTVKIFDTLDPKVLLARLDEQDVPIGNSARFTARNLLEWAWKLYENAFRKLNTQTVQRHLMYRHEFDELMADQRQQKFLAFNTDGDVIGLSVYTNQLEAVHLISPQYFETNYPEHYASERVWWVGFVAVRPDYRGIVTFNELIKAMFAVSGVDALTGIDFAKVNVDRGFAKSTFRYLQSICASLGRTVTYEKIDYQGYFLYEYPPLAEVSA